MVSLTGSWNLTRYQWLLKIGEPITSSIQFLKSHFAFQIHEGSDFFKSLSFKTIDPEVHP